MPWNGQVPDRIGARGDKQNAAFVVAGVAIALAAIPLGAAVANQTASWTKIALIVGSCLVLIGLYCVLSPFIPLPFPSPRTEPFWRGRWSSLAFSKQGRLRRREAQGRALQHRLLNLLAGEAMRSGLNAHRAGQSLLEATLSPGPRRYWVALAGNGYMLGFDASGNIKEVGGPGLDSPEAEQGIRRFEDIVSAAQAWPELVELRRLYR
jgi:hypothetical protein